MLNAAEMDTPTMIKHGDYLLRHWGAWVASGNESKRIGYPKSTLCNSKPVIANDEVGEAVDAVISCLSREMMLIANLFYVKRVQSEAMAKQCRLSKVTYQTRLQALRIAVYASVYKNS